MLLVYDYIPENSHQLISDLIDKENLIVKIVNTRKTKHGDFRKQKNGKFQITINKIDNKYRFLITLIHELAHFKVSSEFKYPTSPHGIEWKNTYKKMMIPFLNSTIFPEKILRPLAKHMINPPATTDSDIDLVLGLHHFDLNNDNKKFLFQIKDNSKFEFNDKRIFIKICKRRKRYICKELKTGKRYLFSPVTRISEK